MTWDGKPDIDNKWCQLLLNALDVPERVRINYAAELRSLFQLKLEAQVAALGVPLKLSIPRLLSKSKADIIGYAPFFDPHGNPHDAGFCFAYGVDGYSFLALNYRHDIQGNRPDAFVQAQNPLLLGNFGVGIDAPASGLLIEPPPEIAVAGIFEAASSKKSSITGWLGARYHAPNCRPDVVARLSAIELSESISGATKPPIHFLGASEFVRMLADLGHDTLDIMLDGEEREARLRAEMGFPPKGKPIREHILYETLCSIFGRGQVVRHYRGKELQGLELDAWIPELRLAFEYQGEQHHERLRHWQKTPEVFLAQQERDRRKARLCQQLGTRLVYLDAGDSLDRISLLLKLRNTGIIDPPMHPRAYQLYWCCAVA